jgi:hypothetical protein
MGDLQPITDAVNRVLRERAPVGQIPYDRLARAEEVARERFPEATRVKALWTPASANSDVIVEVWTGDDRRTERASTYIPSALELVAP